MYLWEGGEGEREGGREGEQVKLQQTLSAPIKRRYAFSSSSLLTSPHYLFSPHLTHSFNGSSSSFRSKYRSSSSRKRCSNTCRSVSRSVLRSRMPLGLW